MINRAKIAIINGPNLNLLSERDPEKYGALSLESINSGLESQFPDISFKFYQFNTEGEIINALHENRHWADGIIVNCGGFSHTSVAIHDALELVMVPKIEVHLSHLARREDFRHKTLTAAACNGYISGFKEHGYAAAVFLILKLKNEIS